MVIALALVYILRPDPSVEFRAFQSRLRDTFHRAGYTIMSEGSCSVQEVPLPLTIEWHPRRWQHRDPALVLIGIPPGADCYTVRRDSSSVLNCFVRYLDGRACYIDIRAGAADLSDVASLRSSLVSEFPGLPIEVTTP